MKIKRIYAVILFIFPFTLFPITAYANSSWKWIADRRPFDILPIVVVLTVLIEYVIIMKENSIKRPFFLLVVVCSANIASFLLPYALIFISTPDAVGYTFEDYLNHLPTYIVGLGYLLLTLVAEVPIVYFSLRKMTLKGQKLLISIIAINIVTTAIVAVVERIYCGGSW